MKVLKLFVIFVIILGGIVGAFFLITPNDPLNPPIIHNTLYQQFLEQFKSDWQTAGDWSEEVFNNHVDLIRQLSAQQLNVDETTSLNDLNTMLATEIVSEKIFEEWKKASCRESDIDKYMRAIDVIASKDSNVRTNPMVDSIVIVNDTYREALKLARKSIGLNPVFGGNVWNSFSDYSNEVINQKNRMLQNSVYKQYLSHISEISNGLNEYNFKLAQAKIRFYSLLAESIKRHFTNIPQENRNRTDLNKLRNIKTKYENEYQSNVLLNNLVVDFANDVNANESRNH